MKKIHIIKLLICMLLFNISNFVFCLEPAYTVKSSEERLEYLVSYIEKNLEATSVLDSFKQEQKNWELYKMQHIETLFPETINGVKMFWGSALSENVGAEILLLNVDRIKILELYINREFGTDGKGEYKKYLEELERIQK